MNFDMYTEAGNRAVSKIVDRAVFIRDNENASDRNVMNYIEKNLVKLAERKFPEAVDTAVRRKVYEYLDRSTA